MGPNDQTRADIGGLFDFYKAMGESEKNIGQVWHPSFALASGALVGSSGVTEALQFQQKLAGVVEAFSKFMSDSTNGVRYLGVGALSIADNYATADMDMAAEMTSVADAFTPTADRSEVAYENSATFASQREAYFHPQQETSKSTLPPPKEQKVEAPSTPTPDQEADAHAKKFRGLETWMPNQPEPETDFSEHVSVN